MRLHRRVMSSPHRAREAFLALLMLCACFFCQSAWAAPGIHASKSTVVASPTSVVADGISTSTITVTVLRANGQAFSGATVTLTAGSGSSIISPASATTNSSGVATFTVKDSVVETVTYTATALDPSNPPAVTLTQRPVVNFVRAAPTVVKSFSPGTIAANGTSQLTITLTNPNTASISGATFTDTYPANLKNASTPAASTTCPGGTATASAGGTSLSLSGATIPASSSCTVTVTVTSATVGSYINTLNSVTSSNAAASASASATLAVTISATNSTVTASPTTVLANGSSTSTITVTLEDALGFPISGQTVTLSKSAGTSSTISAASGTSDANGIVTFTVKDTVAETVTYTASSGGVTITQTASVAFVVTTILKTFSPTTIAANGTSTLTVTLINPNSSTISGAGFSDSYPSGLKNASNPTGPSGSCGGTVSGASGGSSLGLSGATIAKNGGQCTVTVSVTAATAGTYSNTATNTSSITSTASLTVTAISPTLSTVTATTPVLANGIATSTITVTLKDGAGNPVSGKTVTLSKGSDSSIISAASGPSNASGVVTFTATDTIAETATYIAKDTTDNITLTTTASVVYSPITAPTVAKTFSPGTIAENGTTTLTITLTNPNSVPITGAAFTDTYPSGMTNSPSLILSNTCGGAMPGTAANGSTLALSGGTIPASGSCSVSIQVTADVSGSYTNSTGTVTSANASNGASASATLTVVDISNSTVTACSGAASIAADNTTTCMITVTLLDGGNAPVTGKSVTLAAGSGSSTIAIVNATTDANGQATFTVKDSVAETVTYTATDATDGIIITWSTASVTFTSAVSSFNAFETSYPSSAVTGNIYTKIAGTGFSLTVVAVSGGMISSGFNNNVKLELLANTGATPGTGYGADNCPTSGTVVGTTISSQTLSSGHATATFAAVTNAYRDVRVRISYPTASPTIVSCSTDSFSIRPAAFVPAQNTPTLNAGSAFTLQATAVTSSLTTVTTNYTGTPTITTSSITGTPGFTSAALAPQVLPAATGGVSYATFTYDDVGSFTLPATSPGTYGFSDSTFTSVDSSGDCVAGSASYTIDPSGKYGCLIGQSAAMTIGRFYADHFDFTASSFTAGCASGGFTYMDQPFTFGFTVTAKSKNNVALKLYTGGNLYLAAINGTTDLLARLSPVVSSPLSTTWSNGSYTQPSTSYQFTRPTTTTADATWGAYDTLNIGVAIDDPDGAAYSGISVPIFTSSTPPACTKSGSTNCQTYASVTNGATAKMRFGRLWMGNAYGTEKRDLTQSYEIQYWNGLAFVKNTLDSCTALTAANFGLGNRQGTLTAANLPVTALVVNTFSTGAGSLTYTAPNAAGSVDVVAKLGSTLSMCPTTWTPTYPSGAAYSASYLQGNWCSTGFNRDPTSRVTFGIFGSSAKKGPIYIRENF